MIFWFVISGFLERDWDKDPIEKGDFTDFAFMTVAKPNGEWLWRKDLDSDEIDRVKILYEVVIHPQIVKNINKIRRAKKNKK